MPPRTASRPIKDAIEAAMRRRGWTKADLSRASGVPNSSIVRFLNGDMRMTDRNLEPVFDALRLRIASDQK